MKKIIFDVKLVKQNNVDVVEITAKKENIIASTFFNPPTTPHELVIDLTATLNSLMSALEKKAEENMLYIKHGQFI